MTEHLVDKVLEKGICVGCGACAAAAPDEFAVDITAEGQYTARALKPAAERRRDLSDLCPMTGAGPDETEIAASLYPEIAADSRVGRYALCAVGWVAEDDWRARGSSGGLLSWLAAELLKRDLVDEVVQVSPIQAVEAQDNPLDHREALFTYSVSRNEADVRAAAKSRYYPVTATEALHYIRQSGRRTLFIGLPCFVKMIRKQARHDPAFDAAVPFAFGLICGHLKSAAFGELLAWQIGVDPEKLSAEDFRVKIPGQPASSYGFSASDGTSETMAPMADLVGRDWGHGMMKYKACDYCDDVLAECADVAIGDAWLQPWRQDWQGANIAVVRHPQMLAILNEAKDQGRVHLEDVGPEHAAESQGSGLRHRREGLAWRLWRDRRAGHWAPKKRVDPSRNQPRQRQMIYAARERLRDDSHAVFLNAKRSGHLADFEIGMQPALTQYAHAMRGPLPMRAKRFARRCAKAALGLVGLRRASP